MAKSNIDVLLDSILPVWPGDDATKVRQVLDATKGDFNNLVANDPISKIPMA